MFEGIKKKFSKFINSVTKKEEDELEEIKEEHIQEEKINELDKTSQNSTEDIQTYSEDKLQTDLSSSEKESKQTETQKNIKEKEATYITKEKEEQTKKQEQKTVEKKPEDKTKTIEKIKEPEIEESKLIEYSTAKSELKEEKKLQKSEEFTQTKTNLEKPSIQKPTHIEKSIKQDEPKVSFGTRLRGVFSKEVSIKESDIEPFLEDLKISLLESDVNFDAAEKILENIKVGLLSNKISSKNINLQISNVLRSSIQKILEKKSDIDLLELAKAKKNSGEPLKILFIGPNGAGKTTTMAKLANMFIKNSLSVVLSASDTFRAAAIEQTAIHAERLHIGVIKGKYGADPASVAFDAVAHAKAHHINVVLIDSAGRQETNKSLMEEIKKIVRITNPDIKIFVGESITGNSLLEQVTEFNKTVGLDGIILTKLDCDAKGGNTLSILSETNVPVIFFGVGEGYDDLMKYDPDFIINNMIAS